MNFQSSSRGSPIEGRYIINYCVQLTLGIVANLTPHFSCSWITPSSANSKNGRNVNLYYSGLPLETSKLSSHLPITSIISCCSCLIHSCSCLNSSLSCLICSRSSSTRSHFIFFMYSFGRASRWMRLALQWGSKVISNPKPYSVVRIRLRCLNCLITILKISFQP